MNPHVEAHRNLTVKRWKQMVAEYQHPDTRTSIIQLVNTFGGLLACWVAIYFALQVNIWLALLLAIPAGGFMVRIFIIQHDCGHGSFFRSRKANDYVGTACGAFSFVAYRYWRKSHALHHAHSSDLGERGMGDVWTMTVKEYLAAPRHQRIAYRVFRNPVFLFAIAPAFHFLIMHRFPLVANEKYRKEERRSVWWNNLAIAVIFGAAGLAIGFKTVLLIFLPGAILAASFGTWLFYVQHQFEDTYWEYQPAWDYTVAALCGSSYYRLPKVLQWFSGNIGFHHIHHLSPRIPNYKLEQVYLENSEFQEVVELTLWSSLRTVFLTLWDEDEQRLIRFSELHQARARTAVTA